MNALSIAAFFIALDILLSVVLLFLAVDAYFSYKDKLYLGFAASGGLLALVTCILAVVAAVSA